jgi:PAS domain S-box-containing protein
VLSLRALRAVVAAALPDRFIVGIVDLDGGLIMRSAGESGFPGAARTALTDSIAALRMGRLKGVGVDGVERHYAFEPVAGSRWIAVTGVPTERIVSELRSHFVATALGTLLAVALAGWMAVRVGRRISDPILALKTTADRLRRGDLDSRASEQGPLEVAAVGAALNRTIDQTVAMLRTLRESEARHRRLVAMAPDGIAVHEDGRIAYANPRLRQMLGLAGDEFLDDTALLSMVAPEDRPTLAARLARAGEVAMEASAVPLRLHRRDGQAVEVEHSLSSALQHGRIVVQSHFLDVTERNRALAALEQSNETLEARIGERTAQLRSANTALESFSYSVAHDLRSPCGRITGFAQALKEACEARRYERVQHYAERILVNSRTAEGIIEGLLQIAQEDRSPLRVDPICMARQIESVLEELAVPAGVTVHVGELPLAHGDAASLRQVWMNLLSNAVKYCSRAPQPRIEVSAAIEGEQLWFHVRDNGQGFDPADADRLFQPFQRLPGAARFQGSGVGLAIVRRIVERHGGSVSAQGLPGEGATFSFSLPLPRSS